MASVAREAWTDERLDDLKAGMHNEFDRVYREFDQVHAEIRALNARFDAMQRTMIAGFLAVVAAIVANGFF